MVENLTVAALELLLLQTLAKSLSKCNKVYSSGAESPTSNLRDTKLVQKYGSKALLLTLLAHPGLSKRCSRVHRSIGLQKLTFRSKSITGTRSTSFWVPPGKTFLGLSAPGRFS